MIKASRIIHKGEERLKLDFPYNSQIISLVKQINSAAWSQTLKAWHIPYTLEALNELKMLPTEDEMQTTN
jgi:integrase/recombinase XerD